MSGIPQPAVRPPVVLFAVLLLALAARLEAQEPEVIGEWESIHFPVGFVKPDPTTHTAGHYEIAHAVVLPTEADGGQVMLWCRPQQLGGNTTIADRTFLWKATDPDIVAPLFLPDPISGIDGSEGIKGSIHALLPDGRVITACGTNWPGTPPGLDPHLGHDSSFILQSSPMSWDRAGWLTRARWYPPAVVLANGDFMVTGQGGFEDPTLPPPDPPTQETYDVYHWQTGTWEDPGTGLALQNRLEPDSGLLEDCGTTANYSVGGYSPMVQLANGLVFHSSSTGSGADARRTIAFRTPESDACGDARWTYFLHPHAHEAPCDPLPCCPANDPLTVDDHEDFSRQAGGNVLHYVKHKMTSPGPQPPPPELEAHDILYSVGGGFRDSCTPWIFKGVQYLEDPVPPPSAAGSQCDEAYWWKDAPDLNHARVWPASVILADGSIATFGGIDFEVDSDACDHVPGCPQGEEVQGACFVQHTPELCKPPQIFSGSAGTWQPLAVEPNDRQEHQVAGLLPDGRVFVAGGHSGCVEQEYLPYSYYSIDIFKPPYLFVDGPRPVIQNPPTQWQTGTSVSLGLTGMRPGKQVTRVALIRPASSTHSIEVGQRYITLAITQVAVQNGIVSAVTVRTPKDHDAAPPGYYMLVVVNSDGVPSVAKFIQIQP